MPVIRTAESRRTETPNAVMTTLASPTQGGAGLAIWRVDMKAAAAGPRHVIDAEQVWTVIAGRADVDIDGDVLTVHSGDTVVIPADRERRISTNGTEFTAIVVGPPGMRARPVPDGDEVAPPWMQ